MTDAPGPDSTQVAVENAARRRQGRLYALEICFLTAIAIVVIAALLQALSYKLVSSRTPLVIMVPLLILIGVHAKRLWSVRDEFDQFKLIGDALKGQNPIFSKVVWFCVWMIALVAIITVFGHYAGMFLFCVILMHFVAGERLMLSVVVAALTTLFIFLVFEFIFDIQLFRGLILRYFLGFRDF